MAAVSPHDTQKAMEYWGPMILKNNLAGDKLDRLLRGIAAYISSRFEPNDCNDLTPRQLSAFYRSVGGNYDRLFVSMSPHFVGYIFKNLGCLHSLQPDPQQGMYAAPAIPALKPRGFVTWQTIQLLLGPAEHVPFLQNALQQFDIIDPNTNRPFPKYLPAEAFPSEPDPDMEAWHNGVSQRLKKEAHANDFALTHDARSSTDLSDTASKEDAAEYFSNPLYKNTEGKPTIVRTLTKAPVQLFQGVVHTVKTVTDTSLWSGHRSASRDKTHPSGGHSPPGGPRPRDRPSAGRRTSRRSDDNTSSEEVEPRRRLRRHKSHEPPSASGGAAADDWDRHPRSSSPSGGPRRNRSVDYRNSNFRPSEPPPFAAKVGHRPSQPSTFNPHRKASHRASADPQQRPVSTHERRPSHPSEGYPDDGRPPMTQRPSAGQADQRNPSRHFSQSDGRMPMPHWPNPNQPASNQQDFRPDMVHRNSYGHDNGASHRLHHPPTFPQMQQPSAEQYARRGSAPVNLPNENPQIRIQPPTRRTTINTSPPVQTNGNPQAGIANGVSGVSGRRYPTPWA